ncbi:MAG: hypothetical protein JNM68_11970 [Dinghuibacter sp.]|nr:hypothetical protein [Dinghuibacter sp.]
MKKALLATALGIFLFFSAERAVAQCSLCTKSAQQLGDQQAKGLNLSIVYLAFTPFVLIGVIGYLWYRKNKNQG